MDAKQILLNLGINLAGEYSANGQYVADMPDSKTYLKTYSKLDKSNYLYELDNNNLITEHNITVSYLYEDEDTEITIVADLDNEEYKLIVNKFIYDDENEDN